MEEYIRYPSQGAGQICARIWRPAGQPRALVQLVHGVQEHLGRYDHFARYLTDRGFAVVAEDHMGHGLTAKENGTPCFFEGGWFAAVADSHRLMELAWEEFGDLPYVLFGHSMGSFMARTMLIEYPGEKLAGAILCGTGWQPGAMLAVGLPAARLLCRKDGEKNISPALNGLVFGSYNSRVEHKRTPSDWLTRENAVVDAYIVDPLRTDATAGLLRDMMEGIAYIQKPKNLQKMEKSLPCLFVAGGDDPVGAYGKGVRQAARAFQKASMARVDTKLYPLCRHEILNELNREEVYGDLLAWIESKI